MDFQRGVGRRSREGPEDLGRGPVAWRERRGEERRGEESTVEKAALR